MARDAAIVVAMRVFISSVTYALRDERQGLVRILEVVEPFQPLVFEQFTSQDRSSRDACLAGVDVCDVYVLLLGPRYGDPLPDSGMSPTEEEFTAARRQGKPILVFTKDTDEEDEPRQREFKARVEDYVNGRFRKSFSDTQSLNVAVLAALNDLSVPAAALTWERLPTPPPMVWAPDLPALRDPALYAPILEVHLVPVPPELLLAGRLQSLPTFITRTGRDQGFFADNDAVVAGNDAGGAWAVVRESGEGGRGWRDRREHQHRGVAVLATGQVMAAQALPTDLMGTLVDAGDLQRRVASMLPVAATLLGPTSAVLAVAAAVSPLDRLFEGDPARLGGRGSGEMRMRQGLAATMPPNATVSAAALASHNGDVAAEVAAHLLQTVRDAPR